MSRLSATKKWLAPLLTVLAVSSVMGQTSPSGWRPTIQTNTNWTFSGSYQGSVGSVPTMYKNVLLADGTTQSKQIFYSIRVQGVKIDENKTYQRYEISGTDNVEYTGTYIRFWGLYRFGPWTLLSEYYFMRSGEFIFQHSFQGAQPNLSKVEIYQRIDYDLEGSLNNIIEIGGDNFAWRAPGTMFAVDLPAMPKFYAANACNNSYFRIARAVAPQDQLFAVFWPVYATASGNSPITLTAMPYSQDNGNLPLPGSNSSVPLQDVQNPQGTTVPWGSATDQIVYVTLKKPSGYNYFSIGGRVFQKPAGRSLQVYLHAESGIPALSSTEPFLATGRSLNTALNELTDNRWSYTTFTGRTKNVTPHECSDPNSPSTKFPDCLTQGELHDIMVYWREQSGTLNTTTRANFQDWRSDLIVVAGRLDGSPATTGGVMFDVAGDKNWAPREGAAILWTALGSNALRYYPVVAAHELAHTLKMDHPWVQVNHGEVSIENESVRESQQTMQWSSYTKNFIRKGPEADARPGKYGSPGLGNRVDFREYGTGNLIDVP